MLDDSNNHRYAGMDYGGMYRQRSRTRCRPRTCYAFPDKRRRDLALDFELQLFALLKETGKRTVKTHISIRNKPALVWARTVGFRPERWITMVSLDLPLLRNLQKAVRLHARPGSGVRFLSAFPVQALSCRSVIAVPLPAPDSPAAPAPDQAGISTAPRSSWPMPSFPIPRKT